jgi:hypothetical protein
MQADTHNSVIRRIVVSSAAVTTLAGSQGNEASTDGIGSNAAFNAPHGVTMDAAGVIALVVSHVLSGGTPFIYVSRASLTLSIIAAAG